jgi:hypothetical protein
MAQAAHAEPLSGICMIGAVSRGNFQMFILLRDFVVIVASVLILGSGCLTSAHSIGSQAPTNSFLSNNVVGILCGILPIAQSFWFLASIQHLYGSNNDPVVGIGNMATLMADPSLGSLLGGSFFIYILHSCWSDPSTTKDGYQAGRPLYPIPIAMHHGGNLTSTTSVPITASSQRSSANVYPNGPPNIAPPLPPLSTLRQIGNC